ncbi:response regulator transcription factor [Anaerocolumna xylanovorans]|uniref:Stage 0 sporulation protein A homolog n=1 Tax=Anaerocolumna xylanovorans DSM 12503 TaxID=1121345 RepID=A0A1M7Y6M5_9FIRM|nr:response regulator [Anaerocolumna xylanovorans]SHO48315.1 Helix-turn-helix domain-containing protein [Anaerocolumna xylanovorans DSM 12503]
MYKVLVVDDEQWIRKGIVSKLTNHGFQFDWIRESEDAETALIFIRENKPDIVITDIRLPEMSGIDLIREIKKIYTAVQFIIISGYAEFQYAEQALNMGVSSYLLKPVPEEDLAEAVEHVIVNIEKQKEIGQIETKKKRLEESNETLVLERAINKALHSRNEAGGTEGSVQFSPMGEDKIYNYMLLLIHVDSSSYSDSTFKYEDIGLIKYAIKNIADEIRPNNNFAVVDNLKDVTQVMIIIAHPDAEELQRLCKTFAYDLYSKIIKYVTISVTIAISGICSKISPEIYKQAVSALNMRLVNNSRIFSYDRIDYNAKFELAEHQLRILERYVTVGDYKNIRVILQEIFSNDNLRNRKAEYVKSIYYEIIRIILKNCSIMDEHENSISIQQLLSDEVIDHSDNPQQIVDYLYDTMTRILKEDTSVNANCREIIGKAKEYIKRNYVNEITVKELAGHFSVNPNYFSTIFKQETGVTLTNYLKDTRIEKACDLLRNTHSSIHEIAQIVGYEDTQYFYRVFKKTLGITPLEYRNKE